jgi:hypothetical protein
VASDLLKMVRSADEWRALQPPITVVLLGPVRDLITSGGFNKKIFPLGHLLPDI